MMITLHLKSCPLESKSEGGEKQILIARGAPNRWHLGYTGEPLIVRSLGAREQKLRSITANTSLLPPPFIIARPSKKRTKCWTAKLACFDGDTSPCSDTGHSLGRRL